MVHPGAFQPPEYGGRHVTTKLGASAGSAALSSVFVTTKADMTSAPSRPCARLSDDEQRAPYRGRARFSTIIRRPTRRLPSLPPTTSRSDAEHAMRLTIVVIAISLVALIASEVIRRRAESRIFATDRDGRGFSARPKSFSVGSRLGWEARGVGKLIFRCNLNLSSRGARAF